MGSVTATPVTDDKSIHQLMDQQQTDVAKSEGLDEIAMDSAIGKFRASPMKKADEDVLYDEIQSAGYDSEYASESVQLECDVRDGKV